MVKSGRVVAALCLVGLVVFVCRALPGGCTSEDERLPEFVNLNKSLTNEVSDTSSLYKMDKDVETYMRQYALRGVSMSIMRGDSLLYAKGYGWADEELGIGMEPYNIMRVASVSKLLTATGIMKLQEEGRLSLADTVFGPGGILADSTFTAEIKDTNYYKITVEDLLRHKGGFSTAGGDPMFSTRYIMMQNHLDTPPTHDELVRIQLRRKLKFVPGTSQDYSNFGYMLLCMVIEKVSGEDYETYINEHILTPAGCCDMHIANNLYEDRYTNEVRYYSSDSELVEAYDNSGRMVPRCYGGSDIHSLSGAGAWVMSTPELAKFVASIDGRPEVPDIISPESVAAMTEWFDENTYSLGWNDTKPDGEWTRTGTLSSTSALIKYYPDGECWIMVTNTGTWKGPGFTKCTAELFRQLREKYSTLLPERNLFCGQAAASVE